MKIPAMIKHQQQALFQQVLTRVDGFGGTLAKIGVKNNINRHSLIGQAWVQRQRIEGEIMRFDLKVTNTLRPIKKMRSQIDNCINLAIDHLPSTIAKRAHKTHSTIKRISGGC